MNLSKAVVAPWYREPWPWLLMAGPAAVVVAGIATIWIAFTSSDGLVVDDYYKQGLAINQTMARDVLAARRGYQASVTMAADQGRGIRVQLDGTAAATLPDVLRLRVVHPTRAGMDGLVLLRRNAAGTYDGTVPAVADGRRILMLEDLQSSWRLSGEAVLPDAGTVMLKPANLQ